MSEYYKAIDDAEDKRTVDAAKLKLHEMRENMTEQERRDLISFLELPPMPAAPAEHDQSDMTNDEKSKLQEAKSLYKDQIEAWDEKAITRIEKQIILVELKKKRAQRMPFCIVPDAPFACEIVDKEYNSVHRVIVYKPQSEDVIKALRKRGYTPRLFSYNKTAWEEENKERSMLSEQVQNATTQLNKVAVAAF